MFEERLDQLEALWKIYWLDSNSSELRQDIKSRLESAIQKWSLTDIEIVENGYVAFVLLARSNGKAVVLKLLPDNNELKREVEVLRLWKENTSVVNLLDSDDDNLTLLLERIEPGTTLDKSGLDYLERLSIIGCLSKSIRRESGYIPHLSETGLADTWRRNLQDWHEGEYLGLLERLLEQTERDCLIHADLHEQNVILDKDVWRVIDPHGWNTTPEADIWVILCDDIVGLSDEGYIEEFKERMICYCSAADMDMSLACEWIMLRSSISLSRIVANSSPPEADLIWKIYLEKIVEASEILIS